MTNDKEILEIVRGLKIEILKSPNQKQPPAETKGSLEEEKLAETEVQELLIMGAITLAQVSEDQFVSSIFLRPRKDLPRQNDLMVKIELKDAYFSIPLHSQTQRYVKFQWKGNLYQFLCPLPNF